MQVNRKQVFIIIGSIVFTLIINFFIYNLRVIGEYIFQEKLPPFTQPNLARFICYFAFAFLLTKNNSTGIKSFLIFFIPVLLVDSITLITGKDLIPLRFPFATIFPILGIISGIYFNKNKKVFIVIFLSSLSFVWLSNRTIIPGILKYMQARYNIREENKLIINDTFQDVNKNFIALFDTLKYKSSVIEFYFVGCKPCEQKLKYLNKLYDEINNKNFGIILICDGNSNSFSEFKIHSDINRFQNITFLYDYSNSLDKYHIEGYPTEFLLHQKNIIKSEKGFGLQIADHWFQQKKNLINKLLKN